MARSSSFRSSAFCRRRRASASFPADGMSGESLEEEVEEVEDGDDDALLEDEVVEVDSGALSVCVCFLGVDLPNPFLLLLLFFLAMDSAVNVSDGDKGDKGDNNNEGRALLLL